MGRLRNGAPATDRGAQRDCDSFLGRQSTIVISHETQVGLFPWLGRVILAPRLFAANQAMFDDLARAAGFGAATPAIPRRG